MTNNEEKNSEIIEVLQQKFGAEKINKEPQDDELQFLKERYELEQMVWTIEQYYHHYELLCSYGLDQKIMEELEWNIIWQLENNKQEFLESNFFKDFKDHDLVQKARAEFKKRNKFING